MIKIAANLSTLFRHLPWSSRFEAARSAGFDGVEIQFPYDETSASLARAARGTGLPIVLINAPVSSPAHPLGIAGCAELSREFRAQLPLIEEYALALGARYVHVLAGRTKPGAARDSAIECYVENLSRAAEWLGPRGIEVLIEPLNADDAPGYLLDSFDLAARVIERCGAGVGLQFDVYHASRMGLDLLPELECRLELIRHIQLPMRRDGMSREQERSRSRRSSPSSSRPATKDGSAPNISHRVPPPTAPRRCGCGLGASG